jgi:hypothetical protein
LLAYRPKRVSSATQSNYLEELQHKYSKLLAVLATNFKNDITLLPRFGNDFINRGDRVFEPVNHEPYPSSTDASSSWRSYTTSQQFAAAAAAESAKESFNAPS